MAIYVTTGEFFGGFAVRPRRIKAFGPEGEKIYSTPIRMAITRLGIEEGTMCPVGFFDTEHLPFHTEQACREIYGENNWQATLVREIDGLRMPLRKIAPGDPMPTILPGKGGATVISGVRTIASTKSTAGKIKQESAPAPEPAPELVPRVVSKVKG
jgi:hypothetical protein